MHIIKDMLACSLDTLYRKLKLLIIILHDGWLVGWLVVFNVPSTARSLREGTPIYCPLRRT